MGQECRYQGSAKQAAPVQNWTAETLVQDQALLMRRKESQAQEAQKREEEAAKR